MSKQAFEAEMMAEEAFAIRAASLLSRADRSNTRKGFWQ